MECKIFDKKISGPFTIPSGLVATEIPILERIGNEIPEVGILTTKSIGPEPRSGNREPIAGEPYPFSIINAVGLANPGVEEFAKKISKIEIPEDKFLLISIFGGNEEEFRKVAEKLVDFADGFELNISCPHSEKYGQAIGKDYQLVEKITRKVSALGKPVFVKISPNLDIKETVKRAIKGGVSGITAINTKGPELYLVDGHPVLSNKVGGISGKVILELGIKCVEEARKITDLPIIACGGISTAKDIERYKKAGANFFGIGSALTGMNTEEIKTYFQELLIDLEKGTNKAAKILKEDWRMKYKKYQVKEKKFLAEDLFLLKLNGKINIEPGQFVFAWLPEKGEKPFSVLDDEPISLLIKIRGYFTKELSKSESGDIVYLRGPYGNSPQIDAKALLVGGGTGIAGLYLFAKRNEKIAAILGGKDKNSLAYLEEFQRKCEKVYLVTESGEAGRKGLVTDILEEVIKSFQPDYCLNCGPKEMVKIAIQKEMKYLDPEKIYSSIDFLTKCGVGLCGSCSTFRGYRSCVDGTFLKPNQI